MSTIKSSAENLTLNADGANNDVLIQSNGSTVITVDGSATSVGINETAPLGFLHVKNGDSGQGSINAAGNSLVLESNGSTGITFLSGSSSNTSLVMGDSESNYQGVIIYDHSANAMKFATSGTERIRVTDNGLTFNGDTASANALDDYEEGVHTATLTMGSGTASLHSYGNQLVYTKIGRQVHVCGQVRVGSQSSPDGSMQISLPFTVASGNTGLSVGNYRSYNVDTPNDGVQAVIHSEPGQALATIQWSRDGSTPTEERATENGYFMIGLTYLV